MCTTTRPVTCMSEPIKAMTEYDEVFYVTEMQIPYMQSALKIAQGTLCNITHEGSRPRLPGLLSSLSYCKVLFHPATCNTEDLLGLQEEHCILPTDPCKPLRYTQLSARCMFPALNNSICFHQPLCGICEVRQYRLCLLTHGGLYLPHAPEGSRILLVHVTSRAILVQRKQRIC